MKLILHQAGKLTETHLNDSTGLEVAQLETFYQSAYCVVRRFSSTNNTNYFVNIVRSYD